MSGPVWGEDGWEGMLADAATLQVKLFVFCLRTVAGTLLLCLTPLLEPPVRLTEGGRLEAPAVLHNEPKEAGSGLFEEALQTGEGGNEAEACSGVEGLEQMGVLRVFVLAGVAVTGEFLGGKGG